MRVSRSVGVRDERRSALWAITDHLPSRFSGLSEALPAATESLPSADPGFTDARLPSARQALEVEMNKIHATVVAVILGVSGALGVAAATRTAGLRAPTAGGVSDSAIAARAQRLDKVERQIARARRDKPPALPAVPAARTSTPAQRQAVVYRRPAPVVVMASSGHHESEDEHDDDGGHGHEDDDD
jgi:hypothetical protein